MKGPGYTAKLANNLIDYLTRVHFFTLPKYSAGDSIKIKSRTKRNVLADTIIGTLGVRGGGLDIIYDEGHNDKYQNQTGTVTKSWPGCLNHGHWYDVEMSDGQVLESVREGRIVVQT